MSYCITAHILIDVTSAVTLLQMEGMVTDLQLARDKQRLFEEWRREHTEDCKPLAMDLQVTVLTTGFWPSYKVHGLHPCRLLHSMLWL